ncbi:invasion associated locus B family protein [Stappia sp. 28M-7]|uniref:invasion associated locus B family protein n=1 Tax=Stappia sp. 28M-7 TaxID=2762596 RepID=UPI00163CADCE|nr:invasion associated locus B family protein [Stappia sp. 28M-7]MBC2857767.1 invasion associated locus B family protein [Stappia sp. 28M-7]
MRFDLRHVLSSARRAALAGLFVTASLGSATAQDAAPKPAEGAAAPNWIVQCSEATDKAPKRCRALQNIVMQEGGQRLLTVVVEPREGAPNHALVLALPHGVFLPAGTQIRVDEGEPVPMAIQTSDANGAYAGTAISDELLASLKKGQRLIVAFKTAQQQDLAIPVTLIGFTSAYGQLGS